MAIPSDTSTPMHPQIAMPSVPTQDSSLVSSNKSTGVTTVAGGSAFAERLATMRKQHEPLGKSMLTARNSFQAQQPMIVGDTVLTNPRCVERWLVSYRIKGLELLRKYVAGDIAGTAARADIFNAFQEDRRAMFWTGLCRLIGFGCLQRQASGYSIIYTAAEVTQCLESTNYLGFCYLYTGDVLGAFMCFLRTHLRGDPLRNFEEFRRRYGISREIFQKLTIV